MPLFTHTDHPHTPQNPNVLSRAEHATAGFNAKIAIALTKAVGTMACAYCFAILALIGFPGLHRSPSDYVQWVSQTLIQLVMLSVIMVGQSLLGRKQEIQADEAYNVSLKNAHDIAEIAAHLAVQDNELIEQTKILKEIKDNA